MHNRSSIVAYVNQFLQFVHVKCHMISLTAVNIVRVFIKGRRESVSNEQCKVQSDLKVPSNLQTTKCRKPAHSQLTKCKFTKVGTHRHTSVSIPICYAIPVLQKKQNVLPVAHPRLTSTSG